MMHPFRQAGWCETGECPPVLPSRARLPSGRLERKIFGCKGSGCGEGFKCPTLVAQAQDAKTLVELRLAFGSPLSVSYILQALTASHTRRVYEAKAETLGKKSSELEPLRRPI